MANAPMINTLPMSNAQAPEKHLDNLAQNWFTCKVALDDLSVKQQRSANRIKVLDGVLRGLLLFSSTASAYIFAMKPGAIDSDPDELQLTEFVLSVSTAFLSALVTFLGLPERISRYEKTSTANQCYTERCASECSECHRIIHKYREKIRQCKEMFSVDKEASEKRHGDIEIEWIADAVRLNVIYSTWAPTVYDKQGLASRFVSRFVKVSGETAKDTPKQGLGSWLVSRFVSRFVEVSGETPKVTPCIDKACVSVATAWPNRAASAVYNQP